MLTWNNHTSRIEGEYKGVVMQRGIAYQFDLWDGGPIVTCLWDGTIDGNDGAPIMTCIDGGKRGGYRYVPRNSTFFDTLAAIAASI